MTKPARGDNEKKGLPRGNSSNPQEGGATFISAPDTPQTVSGSDGETMLHRVPRDNAPLKAAAQPELPPAVQFPPQADSSGSDESFGTSPTLVGQIRMTPEEADVMEELHKLSPAADEKSRTEPTFLSGNDAAAVQGATLIAPAHKKDSEDFFDTVNDEIDDGKGKPSRGITVGEYQVVGELGRGGMGVVYKARHRKLNRLVALKMILAGKHSGNEALSRFIAEAQAVARLQHPGIVQIFDIGEHQGLPYFSLEFVDGTDLQKDLNNLPRDPKRSAEMVEHLCHAMQYAHDHKILHRDLKPANILLGKDGKPKISDFGLAKNVDTEGSGATSDGTIMGSPSYMPPEQARGQNSSITPRSDLYSLGAILYQMLTARPPFVAERPLETVLQVVNNEPVTVRDLQPNVPVDLETICMKTLQKDPEQRYANCADLAADLRRFINGEPILARPVSRVERLWRWCKRNPKVAVPSALASFFVTATAVIATWAWSETSAQAQIIADERDNVREQRDAANEQRAIAEANEAKAERQRAIAHEAKLQAERNLVMAEEQAMQTLLNMQFFITEIDTQLTQQPGMSEFRIGLLQVIEKRFDELNLDLAGGVLGQAIPTLMAIRFRIAEAWISLDRMTEANETLAKIYEQGKQRLVDKGRTDSTRSNQAMIAERWAHVKFRLTDDPTDGEQLLQESLQLLRDIIAHPLPSLDPKDPSPEKYKIVDTLQKTLLRLASGEKKRGDLNSAATHYAEIAAVCEDVLKDIEQKVDWVKTVPAAAMPTIVAHFEQNRDLGKSGRANVIFAQGKSEEALAIWQDVIKSRRAALEANSSDTATKHQLAIQLVNLGQNLLRIDKADDAAAALAEADQLAEVIYSADSTNAFLKRLYGQTQYYLGTARDAQNLTPDAVARFERSRAIREEMLTVQADRSNRVNLMLAAAQLGLVETVRPLIDELSKSEAKDPELRIDIARALAQLARHSDGDAAAAFRTEALAVLQRSVDEGMNDPFQIATEPDLKPIRDDAAFRSIVEKLTQRRTAQVTTE
jgi:serine/threonine protein kinase/tetratricopeptide (TPR) repeat protein